MYNSYDRLAQLLCEVPEYAVEGRLNKNIVAELARKYDTGLINKLLVDKDMKKLFFSESDAGLIFKKDIFLQFISQKEFLPDSYTAFEQKIGLASNGTMLRNDDRVVLNWPYKDCILEGGQTKEDAKRDEVFFNEILAPDEINTILEDKVFTNWKRYDKDGEHKLDELKPNDNLIIRGNNLISLYSLRKRFAGLIKLIYIDPPFNTGNDSFSYNDSFNHSTWLTFMKNRLKVAWDLLLSEGFIFIEIDKNEDAYLTVLCDELFGREKKIATITVMSATLNGIKTTHKNKAILKQKDSILVYCKSTNPVIKPQYAIKTKWDGHYNHFIEFLDDGTAKDWSLKDYMTAHNIISDPTFKIDDKALDNQEFRNFCIAHSVNIARLNGMKDCPEKQLSLSKQNEVIKDSNGNLIYNGSMLNTLDASIMEIDDKPQFVQLLGDVWTDISFDNIQNEGGNTLPGGKKPESLLRRVIDMTTEPGDIILDYHLGSGTTAATAHKMGRQYIGLEQLEYEKNDSVKRLTNVINGDKSGISKKVNWTGGGSFVYCSIKNDANKFREKVQAADDKKMDNLLNEVLCSSFLSYRIDAKNHKIKLSDFHKLSLADKKHILLDLIDNNTLYLNYSEIDDATYNISDEDKKHNKAFYGE